MKQFVYLWVDLGCLLIPLLASFYPKHAFFKEWKPFFAANFLIAVPFLVWDHIFTTMGVWGFNLEYINGIFIGQLPLEEILFFLCIPFACVFAYFSLEYLVPQKKSFVIDRYISWVLVVVLLIFAAIYFDRWYTVVAFTATALLLGWTLARNIYLGRYYFTYALIFPFFLLSNGILTGGGLDAPIVWYNDMENMGVRLGTIPVEDMVYGMLLIFLNILGFDYFRKYRI